MSGSPQDLGASPNTSSNESPQPGSSQHPSNNPPQGQQGQPGKLQTPPLLHPASATPQARKEKKRVGFHGDGQPQQENRPPSIVIEDDYFAQTMSPEANPFDTPRRDTDSTPAGAPDAGELRRALTQVLISENQDASPSETPARPRPVLRRNTSYDDPQEREKADLAERTAGERQQRSGLEARQRANRLAVSVENYSSPSRRSSIDTVHNPFSDEEDADRITGLSSAVDGAEDRRKVRSRPRKNSHLDAENLVRSHTKRAKKGDRGPNDYFKYQPPPGARSGTATPTLEQSYAHDYVPPPKQYHGGILSSLLKLYNENGSGGSSGRNTPGATTPGTATPNHSPPGSMPASAPPSAPGSPRPSRPNSGLFNYHKKQGSRSSMALAELLKSSSAMAGPASSVFSQGFTEKIKQEPPSRSKRKKSSVWGGSSPRSSKSDDKIRITKHIAQILSRHKYLVKLCRALMLYGAPTHRLEEYMKMSARVLEIEGQFLYIPGCMIISFDDSATHTTEVKIVRSAHGVDLGKLRDVHDIYKQVVHDLISVDEATVMLENITSRKLKFGNWMRVPIYGLASACVAPFAFQGRFIDLPIAFILGCILGWMQLILAPSNELYANVFEITAAIVTSFLARAFGSINNGELFCFSALAQSSIALILPGYMVLCSSLELQSHNLVAGSVRMVYAMIYTLFLGYGTTIGTALYGMIDKHAESRTTCTNPLNRNWYLLFVPGFTLCLCIINQAKWKQTPVMIFISLAGFLVNSYSSDFFVGNPQISNMLGALTVGLLANLYSRLGRHAHNYCLDFLDWWDLRVAPRFVSASRRRNERPRPEMYQMSGQTGAGAGANGVHTPGENTPETAPTSPATEGFSEKDKAEGVIPERKRTIGYGLAAAAMLPAIFVQVPSGLAAGGSLLAGVTSADQITNNNGTTSTVDSSDLNNSAFAVLLSVIQVAIGITVGLFLSALMVYPLGKRRSGLLSF
ncbi:pheromone-regulated membrane protein [Colletotrichum incanum]|uniref:Pheromone-regulated membrane protein n=1 Tax=Colletotrichum incanum TaxID=1573173 RepID=A0A167BIG5_COLIC|nr:pheromone-regulated membrane protein [Colletotrichum incanum]OHW93128.1 pheromone-regulated membrane protein [Colletotrichum incanum]